MERRLLLVFALTFVVIILFQPLLKKYLPQPPAPEPTKQAAQPNQAQPAANNPSSRNRRPVDSVRIILHLRLPSRPKLSPTPSSRTISTASSSPIAAPR